MAITNILQENIMDVNAKVADTNSKNVNNLRQMTRMLVAEQSEMDILSQRMDQSNKEHSIQVLSQQV